MQAAAGGVNPYYVGLNAFNLQGQAVAVTNPNSNQVQAIQVPHFQPSQQSHAQTSQAGGSHQVQQDPQGMNNSQQKGEGLQLVQVVAPMGPPTLSPEDEAIVSQLKGRYGDLINKAIGDARGGDKDAFLKLVKFRRETILMKAKKTKSKDQSRWKTRYTCEEAGCGHQVINNIQHFRRHVVKDHLNGLKIFGCTLCSKAFFTKYDLDIHYNRHLNGNVSGGKESGTTDPSNSSANGTTTTPRRRNKNNNQAQDDGSGTVAVPTSQHQNQTNMNQQQVVGMQQPASHGNGMQNSQVQPIIAIPIYTDPATGQLTQAQPGQYGMPSQSNQPMQQMFQLVQTPDGRQQLVVPQNMQQMQSMQGNQMVIGGPLPGQQVASTSSAGHSSVTNHHAIEAPKRKSKKRGGSSLNQDDIIWALKLKYGAADIDNAIHAAKTSDESVFMKFIPFKRTQLLSDKMKDGKYVQKTLYTCEENGCGHKVVNNIHHFRRHIIRDHLSGLKLFSCEFCTKTFHTKYDLGRHYIRHSKQGKMFPQLQEKVK